MGQATDGGDAVNFYKHHIGDYAQATSHLSFIEDAAYSRLIRKYYAMERPLPADVGAVQRLVGARSKEERQAVADMLDEFFVLQPDGWHNKRCDEEIDKASTQADTNRRIAEEREARKRARTEHDSCTTGARFVHELSTTRQPSQTPDSRHQTPDQEQKHDPPIGGLSPASPDGSPATPAGGAPEEPQGLASPEAPAKPPPCPQAEIIAAYHAALPECPPVRVWTERAATMLRTRWREDPQRWNLDWWREFFAYIRKCPFLLGQKSDFQASLGWLVRPENFAKVLNGNYEARA